MTEQSLYIEGPEGLTLSGILRVQPECNNNNLVIICHGVLGHKNNFFFPLLAERLPYSSYRFDFRGNGDSEGIATYSAWDEDIADLSKVREYLETIGYNVIGIIGHSRGAWISLKYVATVRPVGFVVNVSARYLMADGPKKHSPEELAQIESQGFFMWQYRRKGRPASFKVTKADLDGFANADVSHVRRIPPSVAVLTCHGLEDSTVPVENATFYANLIPNHTLRLIPGADHFYKTKSREVVEQIIDWLQPSNSFSRSLRLDRAFKTIALPRFLPLQGALNVRDLGGYPTSDGYIIRPRKVFRSGDLTLLNEKDLRLLDHLGVHTLFDLRSDPEIRNQGKVEFKDISSIKRIECPVFKEEDYSPLALAQRWQFYTQGGDGFKTAYLIILEKGGDAFKLVFDALASNVDGAILFHCTSGKDRTGVLAMLFLLLMGVDQEIICWDYEQTELFLRRNQEQIDRIVSMSNGAITEEGAKSMISASFDSMAKTLKAFHEKWGSIDLYLDQIGVNADSRRTLREKYRILSSLL